MTDDPILILACLATLVAISEWLVRHTALRHLGSALLVIVLTAIVANVGIIPTYGGVALYDGIFAWVAPLSIFWLLLGVELRRVLRAGLPLLVLFLVGAVGTMAGVMSGMAVVGGEDAFGEKYDALGGMFVGTYTGGSVNYNAIALYYDVVKEGALYAGAAAVDSAMTTVWMAAGIVLPRFLLRIWPRVRHAGVVHADMSAAAADTDRESIDPLDATVVLALGGGALWASTALAAFLEDALGLAVPSILLLTTLSLVLAQFPAVQRLRGARVMGMTGVLLFLAVIGALCDVHALRSIGDMAGALILFVVIIVLVHGLLTFGAAAVLRIDPAAASVASQANIGGGTSALALARSLGRPDLVLPAILLGSLGNALGTYLGFMTARWL